MLRPSTLRPLVSSALRGATTATTRTTRSSFHTTARADIKVGDPLPDLDVLMEGSPGTRVNLAKEAQKTNNMLLIGVPAAFSPACSATHIPGYVKHPRTSEFESVAVVSVNDVFV
jgi:2-Cys peroxiredoxin 5